MSHAFYNYANQEAWADIPGCVSRGSCQSPIDILTKDVQSSGALPQLKFTGWNAPVSGTLQNNGHSIQFTQHATDSPPCTLHNHKGTYVLQQFHFHWGESEGKGSEHRIDGKQYEAELHIVHSKEGATAKTEADAYSVIAVFCKVDYAAERDSHDHDSPTEDRSVWELLDIPQHMEMGKSIDVTRIRYSDLLPKNLDYYYYEGSFTTPPCSEIIQWFVLKEEVKIPASFLDKLRKIRTDGGERVLSFNFRDVQPLNGREVLANSLK